MADMVQGCLKASSEDIPKLLEKAGGTVYCQPKLNGVRAWWVAERKCLRSRTGKIDFTVQASHLIGDLERLWEVARVAPDGELYRHGVPLQVISGACRRREPCSWLEFWVFDCIEEADQEYRLTKLLALEDFVRHTSIRIVPTVEVSQPEVVVKLYERWLAQGFEGIVIRFPHAPYTRGKRAGVAYKIKPAHTMELKIVGFEATQSAMHKDTFGSLILEHPEEGWRVRCAGMTESERRWIWDNREDVVGRLVEVAYDELSLEGKPQRLRFVRLRDSIDF